MSELTPLVAAFLAGLLGSAHCLGMCAGISGMLAVNAGARALATQLPLAVVYNVGRVLSYAALGAAVASFGEATVAVMPVIARPVRLLGGLLIILVGLQIAFDWRLLAPIENAGLALWSRVAPLAGRLLPVTTAPRAVALGLLWGLIPCGLVYSMLLVAASSANPVAGSAIMLCFGAGTMPAMLLTGLGALSLSRFAARTKTAAGLLVVALGILTVAAPVHGLFGAGDHAMHDHRGTLKRPGGVT